VATQSFIITRRVMFIAFVLCSLVIIPRTRRFSALQRDPSSCAGGCRHSSTAMNAGDSLIRAFGDSNLSQ
jgi:hypothetical protein